MPKDKKPKKAEPKKISPPTDEEIDEVLNRIADDEDTGTNRFFGMTYAKGVESAIRWLRGEHTDNPYPEE